MKTLRDKPIKPLLDVNRILRGGLKELHSISLSKVMSLLIGHLPFIRKVTLTPKKHNQDVGMNFPFNQVNPRLEVLKRLSVGDVINENDLSGFSEVEI